jgi:dTDP-glucose pyrophosphorylase
MPGKIEELLEAAKKVKPSTEENEQQRRSFAYGNTNIENSRITRETVDKEAEALKHN